MSGERLSDHLDFDFDSRMAYALKAKLTTGDRGFLADIDEKHDEWGEDMFISDRQVRYLQMLAVRGGWRPRALHSDAEAT
jgi:hypothetical protein